MHYTITLPLTPLKHHPESLTPSKPCPLPLSRNQERGRGQYFWVFSPLSTFLWRGAGGEVCEEGDGGEDRRRRWRVRIAIVLNCNFVWYKLKYLNTFDKGKCN